MDELIETYSYRGFSFPVYYSEEDQQFFIIWEGKQVGFGRMNTDYRSALQYIVDDHLDTLIRFDEPYSKAKLKLFQNGDYQDVGLIYDRRMIKLWLVADKEKFSVDKLKTESLEILKKWTGR